LTRDDSWKAELRASEVLTHRRIEQLPIDPFAIAQAEEITCEENASLNAGISGCLMKIEDCFGIIYSSRFSSVGFKRFTVAHELGHYYLDGHADHLFKNAVVHTSESGFTSNDKYEREADCFAAGLLMPKRLFTEVASTVAQGLAAVERLSETCITSLTATAIRYANLTEEPVAIICSRGDRVEFCFMSKPLKELRGLNWLARGSGLPVGTVTESFNRDPSKIALAKRASGTSTLTDWFDGTARIEVREDVVGLGEYGKTLTILSAESLPDEEDLDEEEHDEDMLPSQRWRQRS
jgi:Zn-dependent peptidase ImmA (M78 family)